MKQITTTVTAFLLCLLTQAQYTTPLSLISTVGGIVQTTIGSNAHTVEWTLGETFIFYGTAAGLTLTNGQQQALSNFPTSTQDYYYKEVKVYPNPARDLIHIEGLPTGTNYIVLSNMLGNAVKTFLSNKQTELVAVNDLPSGAYNLMIYKNEQTKSNFKIIITYK